MWDKKSSEIGSVFLNLAIAATKVLTAHVAEICTQKLNELRAPQSNKYQAARQGDFDKEDEVSAIQQTAQANSATAQDNYSPLHSEDDTNEERPSF